MPEIRNFIGYGNNPPIFRWDNNAKLAVQFVLNYEEGGENTVLNGDEQSEIFLSEIIGAQPVIGQRHMNMVLGVVFGEYIMNSQTEIFL